MEQATLERLALPSKTSLPILFFRSIPIPPYFLALSSSKDKTIVYLVDVVTVDKEVDNRAVARSF
jgi:hypothetical protein